MSADVNKSSVVRYMVGAAAFVVIIAGMKAASAILIPFLLSAFLAVISAPSLFWMKRKGLPTWLALLAVVLIISVGVTAVSTVVGTSVAAFSQNLPGYQAGLQEKTGELVLLLDRIGFTVPEDAMQQYFNPGLAMRMVQNLFTAFGGVLSNVFLILLTVIHLALAHLFKGIFELFLFALNLTQDCLHLLLVNLILFLHLLGFFLALLIFI
jgi:AI-2 transport protein TqsA